MKVIKVGNKYKYFKKLDIKIENSTGDKRDKPRKIKKRGCSGCSRRKRR